MRSLFCIVLTLLLAACQGTYCNRLHLIQTEASGVPLNPKNGEFLDLGQRPSGERKAPEKYYEDYLAAMFNAADGYNDRVIQAKTKDGRPIRRILIHVHGGLNSHDSAAGTARDTVELIKQGLYNGECYPDARAYPIYLTWNSGPISTYFENVYPTRRGYYTPVSAAISAPGQIVSDLGRGVGRFPMTIWRQISTEWQSTLSINGPWLRGYYPSWKHAHKQHLKYSKSTQVPKTDKAQDPQSKPAKDHRLTRYDLQKGTFFARGWLSTTKRVSLYTALLGLRLPISPIFLDGLGESAWGIMRRRADSAFLTPKGLEGNSEDKEGAFLIFFQRLKQHIHAERQDAIDTKKAIPHYEVTLVGHSMGAIILNKALRAYDTIPLNKRPKDSQAKQPVPFCESPFKNIVYMGAACSIDDGFSSILPYLARHKDTEFYNLTLHPVAEISEERYIVARGSLLEWIDNWYDNPATILEHRFGKWNNLMHALHILDNYDKSITDRFHVKAFGRRAGYVPQGHGEFNQGPFWLKSYWTVGEKKNIAGEEVYEYMHFKPYNKLKEREYCHDQAAKTPQ